MSSKSNFRVQGFSYDDKGKNIILHSWKSKNWPFVYLIHDTNSIYIGETQSIFNRTKQHLDNADVKVGKNAVIHTIYSPLFNKSAVLDIENILIMGFSSESKFKVLNLNRGQSTYHDYYQRDYYHNELVDRIWNRLMKLKLSDKPLYLLKNLDVFKFSPYVSLTNEQLDVCTEIVKDMVNTLGAGNTGTYVVRGSAGTGKTVLSIYLLSILKECVLNLTDSSDSEGYDSDMTEFNVARSTLVAIFQDKGIKKIGFVVPMTSLRNTLKKVFRQSKLKGIDVIGPDKCVTKDYDILFVDEAHRLFHRKNLTNYNSFDTKCRLLDLDPFKSNQLQWIMMRSKYCVLFYDEKQSVKKSDITKQEFINALKLHKSVKGGMLTSQLRCESGDDYIKYIDDILDCRNPTKLKPKFYDLRLFDDIHKMVNLIKNKESTEGLSRLMAGYGWEWKTKGLSFDEIKARNLWDIEIDGEKMIWNTCEHNWINSKHAKDEVGCVHTTQGFDLNYAGIIFGPEIDYNPSTNKIEIDSDLFFDSKVKAGCTKDELKQFIINSYCVMLKRGIKGTYIYCVNDNLRAYLSKFIDLN